LGVDQLVVSRGSGSPFREIGPQAPRNSVGMPFLSKEHHFRDNLPSEITQRNLSLAKMIRGLAVGNWSSAAEEKPALAEQPPSQGGILMPIDVSSQIIDLLRSATVVIQAGGLTIPAQLEVTRLPVQLTDPVAEWKQENASIGSETDITFDSIEITPHTLIAILRGSVELFEDAPNLAGFMETTLRRPLGAQVDYAALAGTGSSNQPQGLLHNPNVVQQSAGPMGYDDISHAVDTVAAANGAATEW